MVEVLIGIVVFVAGVVIGATGLLFFGLVLSASDKKST